MRKRILKKNEEFPSPDAKVRALDNLVLAASIISPLMTAPQVWKVWVEQETTGISLITWGTFTISGSIWLTYGLLHKEFRIVTLNILLTFFNGLVFTGTLIYS